MTKNRYPAFVDTHVHFWNFEDHPWYPEIMDRERDRSGTSFSRIEEMRKNYLLDDYLADTAAHGVAKVIHVSAAQGGENVVSETRWLEEMAGRTGMPHALIGQIEPRESIEDIKHCLAAQLRSPMMRGVRITFHLDPDSDKALEIVSLVADAGCLLEIVTQPHNAASFAALLDSFPDMTTIIEHSGWPTGRDDPAHFDLWRDGMARLASREKSLCKLSGLPMALQTHDLETIRPWTESCIDLFGDERCMFGSNFPVDRLFGSFEQIFGAYHSIVRDRDEASKARLFATNAERVYAV